MIIERTCPKCGAHIKAEGFKVDIDSKGPLCDDCVEFIRNISQQSGA